MAEVMGCLSLTILLRLQLPSSPATSEVYLFLHASARTCRRPNPCWLQALETQNTPVHYIAL